MSKKLDCIPLGGEPEFNLEKINNLDDLILLPLTIGMNHPDWKYSQYLCLKLVDHIDWRVQANALKGLEYTAKTKGKLEKHLVKPVLIKALRSNNYENLDIIHVTEKINSFLGWKVGLNQINKLKSHQLK